MLRSERNKENFITTMLIVIIIVTFATLMERGCEKDAKINYYQQQSK